MISSALGHHGILEFHVGDEAARLRNDPEVFAPNEYTWALVEGLHRLAPIEPSAILDVGTGSGVLAIHAGLCWPSAGIAAIDISHRAAQLARENLATNGLGEPRCEVHEVSVADFVPDIAPDLILANLPQMPTGGDDDTYVAGGSDGLEVIRQTLAWTARHVAPGGRLCMTVAEFLDQRRISELAGALGLVQRVVHRHAVRPGPATMRRRPWLEQRGFSVAGDIDVLVIEFVARTDHDPGSVDT